MTYCGVLDDERMRASNHCTAAQQAPTAPGVLKSTSDTTPTTSVGGRRKMAKKKCNANGCTETGIFSLLRPPRAFLFFFYPRHITSHQPPADSWRHSLTTATPHATTTIVGCSRQLLCPRPPTPPGRARPGVFENHALFPPLHQSNPFLVHSEAICLTWDSDKIGRAGGSRYTCSTPARHDVHLWSTKLFGWAFRVGDRTSEIPDTSMPPSCK